MEKLFDDSFPLLPYKGTSGWSGSETSRDRAVQQDAHGITSKRQKRAFDLVASTGTKGITWQEGSKETGMHHGSISGVLTVLHKAGLICRLTESRNRCQVYLLPEFVNGRELSPYRPNSSAKTLREILNQLDADLRLGDIPAARKRISQVLAAWDE